MYFSDKCFKLYFLIEQEKIFSGIRTFEILLSPTASSFYFIFLLYELEPTKFIGSIFNITDIII